MIVRVSLHCTIVNDVIGLHHGFVWLTVDSHTLHRWTIEVDLVVYYKEWVVCIHYIVVNADTV